MRVLCRGLGLVLAGSALVRSLMQTCKAAVTTGTSVYKLTLWQSGLPGVLPMFNSLCS